MGDKNSSITRVVPVFEALFERDVTGIAWLDRVVALPVGGTIGPKPAGCGPGVIQEGQGLWGGNEKTLQPPLPLLKWLVRNPRPRRGCSLGRDANTIDKRRRLIEQDAGTIEEALRELDQPVLPESAWFVLEGPSCPDAFLRTPSTIIVIEGKRTESKPTRHTTWMPVRDQLLRHIDCAWEIRGGRQVLGLLIVEGEGGSGATEVPRRWVEWVGESRSGDVLASSLPHRSDAERRMIADAVLGVTTWQKLCAEFSINWASLPDRCG